MQHHSNNFSDQAVEYTFQLARYLETAPIMGDNDDPFRTEKAELEAMIANTDETTDVKTLKMWGLNSSMTTYSVLDGNFFVLLQFVLIDRFQYW